MLIHYYNQEGIIIEDIWQKSRTMMQEQKVFRDFREFLA